MCHDEIDAIILSYHHIRGLVDKGRCRPHSVCRCNLIRCSKSAMRGTRSVRCANGHVDGPALTQIHFDQYHECAVRRRMVSRIATIRRPKKVGGKVEVAESPLAHAIRTHRSYGPHSAERGRGSEVDGRACKVNQRECRDWPRQASAST